MLAWKCKPQNDDGDDDNEDDNESSMYNNNIKLGQQATTGNNFSKSNNSNIDACIFTLISPNSNKVINLLVLLSYTKEGQ